MKKKNIKDIEPKELEQLYSMVEDEIMLMNRRISEKSGYFTTGQYSLMGCELKKCLDIDMKIALLETPHEIDEFKVKHYMKNNPDNVLNKPILAHENNSWYMIFDGVHRTEANRRLGKETVKAHIIVPSKDK